MHQLSPRPGTKARSKLGVGVSFRTVVSSAYDLTIDLRRVRYQPQVSNHNQASLIHVVRMDGTHHLSHPIQSHLRT